MELTDRDTERIPRDNLRVPRAEFVVLWTAAEDHHDRQTAAHIADWSAWGVAATCRWLARATSRSASGQRYVSPAPATGQEHWAMPETIEAEFLRVEVMLLRQPPVWQIEDRPGWLEAIHHTLAWAWRRKLAAPVIGETQRAAG